MNFQGRHVIVTGGTGAPGQAVVGARLAAGATCHVPYGTDAEARGFALRGDPGVMLVEARDLSEEPAVARLFDGVPALWASLHIAGGFAYGALAEAASPSCGGRST